MSDNNIVNSNADVQESSAAIAEEATATTNEPAIAEKLAKLDKLLTMISTGVLTNAMLLLTPKKKRKSTMKFMKAHSKQLPTANW